MAADGTQANLFSLRARREGGGTSELKNWGANSDYGTLRSVLLGPIENYQWLKTSSLSKKSIRRGVPFDPAVAKAQHSEMVDAYRSAGVDVHPKSRHYYGKKCFSANRSINKTHQSRLQRICMDHPDEQSARPRQLDDNRQQN